MVGSFLQSNEWIEFQRSLGREVFEYREEGISAKIIKHDLPLRKNYLYIPHGPAMDFNEMTGGFKNPARNFVRFLRDLGHSQKTIFIKAEPSADNVAQFLVQNGFKKTKKEIQPSKSVVVDIGGDESDILGRMHHKTRYNIGVAEKHGISVQESQDADAFWKLLKRTAARDRFSTHLQKYYEKLLNADGLDATLFMAYFQDEPLAGAIVLIYGDTGYYLHGASDYAHRSLMAPYMLHWQIIKFLKERGIKSYNLWGIDAKKWPGVTRFKLGWGGKTVELPGSFDLTISKTWYLVYKVGKRIF